MKTEKEIRLRRLEIVQAIFKQDETSKKFKEKFGGELPNPTIDSVYKAGFAFSLEMLNWVLDESSGMMLDKSMSLFDKFVKALTGGSPGSTDWELAKTTKEFSKTFRQIIKDYKDQLTIDWNDLESK